MDAAKEWVRSKAATTGHPLHTEYAKLTELFEERYAPHTNEASSALL